MVLKVSLVINVALNFRGYFAADFFLQSKFSGKCDGKYHQYLWILFWTLNEFVDLYKVLFFHSESVKN